MSGRRIKKIRAAFEQVSGLKLGTTESEKSTYKQAWHRFKKSLKRRY
jgi:hypothetical protein